MKCSVQASHAAESCSCAWCTGVCTGRLCFEKLMWCAVYRQVVIGEAGLMCDVHAGCVTQSGFCVLCAEAFVQAGRGKLMLCALYRQAVTGDVDVVCSVQAGCAGGS
jgi:hypothetical protein